MARGFSFLVVVAMLVQGTGIGFAQGRGTPQANPTKSNPRQVSALQVNANQAARANSLVSERVKRPRQAVASPWKVFASHSSSTDLIAQGERVSFHSFGFGISFSPTPRWSFAGNGGVIYEAVEKEVVRDRDNPDMADLSLAGTYNFEPFTLGLLSATLGNQFPTSQSAQAAGFKSVVFARLGLASELGSSGVGVNSSLSTSRFINSFATTDGRYNPESVVGAGFGLNWKFAKIWMLGASVDARSIQFTDGFRIFRAGNAVRGGLSWGRLSSTLVFANGADPTLSPLFDSLRLVEVDRYRRMVGLDISWVF